MHVAVIGTGIAGGAAAWTLSKRYSVTVYDREMRLSIGVTLSQMQSGIGFWHCGHSATA